jgi:Tfp pilus assembly protein PilV
MARVAGPDRRTSTSRSRWLRRISRTKRRRRARSSGASWASRSVTVSPSGTARPSRSRSSREQWMRPLPKSSRHWPSRAIFCARASASWLSRSSRSVVLVRSA